MVRRARCAKRVVEPGADRVIRPEYACRHEQPVRHHRCERRRLLQGRVRPWRGGQAHRRRDRAGGNPVLDDHHARASPPRAARLRRAPVGRGLRDERRLPQSRAHPRVRRGRRPGPAREQVHDRRLVLGGKPLSSFTPRRLQARRRDLGRQRVRRRADLGRNRQAGAPVPDARRGAGSRRSSRVRISASRTTASSFSSSTTSSARSSGRTRSA